MKKFLALLLALLMCVSVLASCGGNTDDAAGATLDEAKELLLKILEDIYQETGGLYCKEYFKSE